MTTPGQVEHRARIDDAADDQEHRSKLESSLPTQLEKPTQSLSPTRRGLHAESDRTARPQCGQAVAQGSDAAPDSATHSNECAQGSVKDEQRPSRGGQQACRELQSNWVPIQRLYEFHDNKSPDSIHTVNDFPRRTQISPEKRVSGEINGDVTPVFDRSQTPLG